MCWVFLPTRTPELRSRRALRKDPEIIRRFGGSPGFAHPIPMTRIEATLWYENVGADPNPVHWVVDYEGRIVGTTRLHSLLEDDQKARYAVGLLDRTIHGRGLGKEITNEVLRYGFEVVGPALGNTSVHVDERNFPRRACVDGQPHQPRCLSASGVGTSA